MNDIVTITRSKEDGIYILREGDYLIRVNEDGGVEHAIQKDAGVFELLDLIHQWKLSAGIRDDHPCDDSSD